MFKVTGAAAYDQLTKNVRAKKVRIPPKTETAHFRDGGIFPPIAPRFHLDPGQSVFTIGSCFARNIEIVLRNYGLTVPVSDFRIPDGELPHPAPHLLNEYNAGTILQRLESSVGAFSYKPAMGLEESKDGLIDLFLHIHSTPVERSRLIERRHEIDALYKKLPESDVVVITLGLVESWYDTEFNCYLNRAPSRALTKAHPDRFEFHRLDYEDVVGRMRQAITILKDVGTRNILLTVSPVPIEATFMSDGAVIANSYSKAVLRVTTETLVQQFDFVDYFPSYEIATSFGTSGYTEDNVHVDDGVVGKIVAYMIDHYQPKSDATAKSRSDIDYHADFWAAVGSDHLEQAEDVTRTMLKVLPDNWRTYDAIGHLNSLRGNHVQALANAERSMEIAGRNWGHLARIGCIYEDMGKLDTAESLLLEATQLPDGGSASQWLDRVRNKRLAKAS